jgi:hypothetical protein
VSSTKVVYRSEHPDVLAHHDSHVKAFAAWKERVRAVLVELGFAPDRGVWMRDTRVVGVVEINGEPLPDGWRHDRKNPGAIVPARTKQPGKGYGQKLDALKQPDPRNGIPGGMPGRAFQRGALAFMHCGLQEFGGAIYVTWPGEPDSSDRIDSEVWKPIKLSEYYAAVEAVTQ